MTSDGGMLSPSARGKKYSFLPGVYDPQPSGWKNVMNERDGRDSGASVVLCRYRRKALFRHHTLLAPMPFEVIEREINYGYDATQDPSPNEWDVELLITVKRGRDAEYMIPEPGDKTRCSYPNDIIQDQLFDDDPDFTSVFFYDHHLDRWYKD
ncbi:Uu.00g008540.m01.CDS01 [Anthostomella pinea]|uniref:Uu.00g008540.m01.CDS01 n=1 Tax=Anthostomella pinea TaxID=933095 RepID=A0AAI8VY45_9PEZI|nr:Uu.00g008540.m01.CDS01 [Anthostomella pinea]